MKILKKIKKSNGRRNIFLCGIKIASYRRRKAVKSSCKMTYDTFAKYVDTVNDDEIAEDTQICVSEKNRIWQCWWQGEESAPPIVRKCFESVRRYAENCEIVIITKTNYSEYISIPDCILDKFNSGVISVTHLSDYIRCALLSKWGGLWIDSTCYLTNHIPTEIMKAPFFQFRVPCVLLDVPNGGRFSITGSSWFLRAAPGCEIIVRVKKALEEYWTQEDGLIDYFLFHYLLSAIVTKDIICRQKYLEMEYRPNDVPHLMQGLLRDKFDKGLYEQVSRLSFIHKLTYKNIEEMDGTLYSYLLNSEYD